MCNGRHMRKGYGMFDWNGNGRIDTDDLAFTAFLIDEMNKQNEENKLTNPGFPEEDDTDGYGDYDEAPDYGNSGDGY